MTGQGSMILVDAAAGAIASSRKLAACGSVSQRKRWIQFLMFGPCNQHAQQCAFLVLLCGACAAVSLIKPVCSLLDCE
jgi:hypothetical protein